MGVRAFVSHKEGVRFVNVMVEDNGPFALPVAQYELTAGKAEELAKQLRDAARQVRALAVKM